MVLSVRQKTEQTRYETEGYTVFNITSNGPPEFRVLSPFYPIGNIPVVDQGQAVLEPGTTSASVEGLWQGLKVFEKEPIDRSKFENTSLQNLKRKVTDQRGRVQGHQGAGGVLLDYVAARKRLYLPAYELQLRSAVAAPALQRLRTVPKLVLLDYTTNANVEDTYAHAAEPRSACATLFVGR